MAYAPFASLGIDTYFLTNGLQAALYHLNKALSKLELPTIGGIPIKSIADLNLTHDNQGNLIITVKQIGDLFVRYNDGAGILEQSLDGATWSPLIAEGNGTPTVNGNQLVALDDQNLVSLGNGVYRIEVDHLTAPVTLGNLKIRETGNAFQLSADNGVTWQSVGIDQLMPLLHLSEPLPYTIPDGDRHQIVSPDSAMYGTITLPLLANSPRTEILILGMGVTTEDQGQTYHAITVMTQGDDLILNSQDGTYVNSFGFDTELPSSFVALRPAVNATGTLFWRVTGIFPDARIAQINNTLRYRNQNTLVKSANYTIPDNYCWYHEIICTSAITVTLPDLSTWWNGDVWIVDQNGSGLTIAAGANDAGKIQPGAKSTLTNSSPSAFDFIHLRCLGDSGAWLIQESRGTWA